MIVGTKVAIGSSSVFDSETSFWELISARDAAQLDESFDIADDPAAYFCEAKGRKSCPLIFVG
jgi:hypothetical protein